MEIQRKQVIKTVSDLINKVPTEDSKGKPLSDQDRASYLYNLVIKKNIADTKSNVSEVHAEKLKQREEAANMYNTSIVAPELSKKQVEEGLANQKFPDLSVNKHMEGNGAAILKYIQDHVTGRNETGEGVGKPPENISPLESMFGNHLVDAAIKLLPDEEKQRLTDIHDLADQTGEYTFPQRLKEQLRTPKIQDNAVQEQSASSILQHPQRQELEKKGNWTVAEWNRGQQGQENYPRKSR